MGTNYYARIIPSHERKEKLKELIDNDDFDITSEVDKTYGIFTPFKMDDVPVGEIHLGKASGGWKFLWNPNVYVIKNGHVEEKKNRDGSTSVTFVREPDTAYYLYPLTKKGIKEFIDREDVVIYDEYGDKQDKEVFFKEALEHTTWGGKEAYDAASYERENDNGRSGWRHVTDLTELLKEEGFEFTTNRQADFYSDGLRFSSSTDFS